jgi:hypothetical protein
MQKKYRKENIKKILLFVVNVHNFMVNTKTITSTNTVHNVTSTFAQNVFYQTTNNSNKNIKIKQYKIKL